MITTTKVISKNTKKPFTSPSVVLPTNLPPLPPSTPSPAPLHRSIHHHYHHHHRHMHNHHYWQYHHRTKANQLFLEWDSIHVLIAVDVVVAVDLHMKPFTTMFLSLCSCHLIVRLELKLWTCFVFPLVLSNMMDIFHSHAHSRGWDFCHESFITIC